MRVEGRRPSLRVALAAAAVILALPATASAADRFASPTGSGPVGSCPESNPCSLQTAVEDVSVNDGDVIKLAPGTYTENSTLFILKDITVQGSRGAPTDAAIDTTAPIGVFVDSQLAVVQDLSINQTVGQDALLVIDGTAQRVMSLSEGQFACTVAGPIINRALIRDSSCIGAGAAAIAALRTTGGGGVTYGKAVNVTARGIGSNSVGVLAVGGGGGLVQLELLNTIAEGVVFDIRAQAQDPGSSTTVFADSSNYATEQEAPMGGGAVAVSNPGSGTNQTAEPVLGAFQYPSQLPGSPTINAGAADPALGSFDLAGGPRVEASAPDIGADEADGVSPLLTIVSGPSGPTADSTPTFTFSSSEPATFECRFEGDLADFAPCSGPGESHTAALAGGGYTFTVRGTDIFGNTSSATSLPFRVDATAPEAQITQRPRRRTRSRNALFGFGSADPTATFECKLDRGAFAPCTSPQRFRRIRRGRHTFQVRATDDLGNVESTPAVARWRRTRR